MNYDQTRRPRHNRVVRPAPGIEVVHVTSYHVLVPVDRNDTRAQRQAEHVLSLPHAAQAVRATLLHVYPTVDGDAGTERLGDHMDQPATVETVRQALTDGGIAVEKRGEEGDVADTILEVEENLDPDVVVISGRKRSPVGKAIFGSVSQEVILKAEGAVTVVK